jgi:hypothetical protein
MIYVRSIICTVILLLTLNILSGCDGSQLETSPDSLTTSSVPPTDSDESGNLDELSEIKIVDQIKLEIENGYISSISPNGDWLLIHKQNEEDIDEFCIYGSRPLDEIYCVNFDVNISTREYHIYSIWSPDSNNILFRILDANPDSPTPNSIQILSVKDAVLQDMTMSLILDNGFDFLTWMNDNESFIYSTKYIDDEEIGGAIVYKFEIGSGKSEELFIETFDSFPGSISPGKMWTTDDMQTMIYSVVVMSDPMGGAILRATTAEDGYSREILVPFGGQELGIPSLRDVTNQWDYALITHGKLFGSITRDTPFSLLNLNNGESNSLGKLDPIGERNYPQGLMYFEDAAFSPDGSKIVRMYRDDSDELRLTIYQIDGGFEYDIWDPDFPEFGLRSPIYISWTGSNTIIIVTIYGSYLLLLE